MKKRKELNALVSNGKAGKRIKMSSGYSAHKLLKADTDTSDMEDFTVLQSRKSRKNPPLPLSAICLPLCQFVLVTTCILISGTLIWLHIGLRENLDVLRAHLQKVEASNRNTPEQLHTIHSKLKDLDSNITSLFIDIKKNIQDIENATAEIKHLKEATVSLQNSIDAAPFIEQLPKDVKSLSERVVTFGSKISHMESTVDEVKKLQSTVQSTTNNLTNELESLKVTVQDLCNNSKTISAEVTKVPSNLSVRDLTFQSAIQNTKQRVTSLQQELLDLTNLVETMNVSFKSEVDLLKNSPNEAMESLMGGVKLQQTHFLSLESNISSRMEHIEMECCRSTDKQSQNSNFSEVLDLVNKTITQAVVNIVYSDLPFEEKKKIVNSTSENLLIDTYNGLLFLTGLLRQFNTIPNEDLVTEKNATIIVSHLLNATFHELMQDHDVKIEVLQGDIKKLFALLRQTSATTVLTYTTPDSSTAGFPTTPLP